MDWNSPFVVYRVSDEGKLEQVFAAQDFQEAIYWLSYIAQTGDVLCKTPVHRKHSHSSQRAEYWSHKGTHRSTITDEQLWRKLMSKRNFNGEFPDHQNKQETER